MSYRNAEHYYDPTAGEALENIAREERRKRRLERTQSDVQPSDQKTTRPRYVNKPKSRRY